MAQGSSNPTTDIKKVAGTAVDTNTGNASAGTQRVVLATDQPAIPVSGTFYQATQPVSIASMPTTTVTGPLTDTQLRATAVPVSLASNNTHDTVAGTIGQLSVGYASSTAPTAVAAGDAARIWTTLNGAVNIADGGSNISIDDGGNSITVDGTFWQATQPVSGPLTDTQLRATAVPVSIASMPTTTVTGPLTDTELRATAVPVSLTSVPTHAVTQSGTWNVTDISGTISLPTGASTETTLLANNALLTTIDVDTGFIRTAVQLIDNSISVQNTTVPTSSNMVGAVGQSTAPTAVTDGYTTRLWATLNGALNIADGDSTISIDDNGGSITVDGPLTDTQLRATPVPVSGPLTDTQLRATAVPVSLASVPTHAVTQSGTWTVTTAAADTHDAVAGTIGQMSVGYASSTAPTAVAAGDAARIWTTLNGAVNIADGGGSITVDGPLTDTQLRATAVPVSGTFYQATQPVSLASVPSHAVTLASTTITGSVAVTGTFWQTTQPVSGTVTANLAADDVHDGVAGTTAVMMGGYAYGVAIADNTLPAISANADAARILVNKNGATAVVHLPEATQAYAPTNATTTAYAASLIAKASAGTLYMITGYNSGEDQFIQIHDSATLPADAAVPKVIFLVPAASNFSYDLGNYGRYFAAGITICNSTTGPTKTIGAADCWIDVQYK